MIVVEGGEGVEVVVSLGGEEVCDFVEGCDVDSVGDGLALVVVAFVSSRFASFKIEVARAGSSLCTASIALCSDSNTPSRNRSGRYR